MAVHVEAAEEHPPDSFVLPGHRTFGGGTPTVPRSAPFSDRLQVPAQPSPRSSRTPRTLRMRLAVLNGLARKFTPGSRMP